MCNVYTCTRLFRRQLHAPANHLGSVGSSTATLSVWGARKYSGCILEQEDVAAACAGTCVAGS